MDDQRYFPALESALRGAGILDEILRECRDREDTVREFSTFLSSGEYETELWREALDVIVAEMPGFCSGVSAFHGCRVYPHSTYETEGILPLTADRIEHEIMRWAGSIPPANSRAEAVLRDYLRKDTGKVYTVRSLQYHQDRGGLCHARGSETLRTVLRELCPGACERMLSEGEPSILEIQVPVPSFPKTQLRHLCGSMLSMWIASRTSYPCAEGARCGGVVFDHSIPASWIVKRFRCDEAGIVRHQSEAVPTRAQDWD